MTPRIFVSLLAASVLAILSPSAALAVDGIKSLISVTQTKADNANDDAMAGAEKQRKLIQEKKTLRDQQRAFERTVKGSSGPGLASKSDKLQLQNKAIDSGMNEARQKAGTAMAAQKLGSKVMAAPKLTTIPCAKRTGC